MRIISGKFRGRKLVKSDHLKSLRPTTDANREALFNILNSARFLNEISFKLIDAVVLDVCCGSGAVGFEALSRGAKSLTLIDNNRAHLELAAQNAEILKVKQETEILSLNAENLPQNDKIFDLIFVDPPYEGNYSKILTSLFEKNWISKTSLLVVETPDAEKLLQNCKFLKALEIRKYGSTNFLFAII